MPALKSSIGTKALQDLLGVSKSAVFAWKDAGCPHRRGAHGFEFVVADVVAWLEKRAEERGRKSAETQDGQSPYNRKQLADAQYRELQVEQLRGDLIDAATAEAEYQRFVGGFAAVAAGRLQHFERDIVQASMPADARRLTQRMHVALLEGAREYAAAIEEMPEEDSVEELETDLTPVVEDVA